MTTKCNCNQCSTHIEFDSQDAGQTITCPKCGMETTLYIPQLPKPPTPNLPLPREQWSPYGDCLAQVRSDTCYKTLRVVIDVAFKLSKILVGVFAVIMALGTMFGVDSEPGIGTAMKVLIEVGVVLAAVLVIGLLHAGHQAAFLLVDIADCTVRLVKGQEARYAG